MFRRGFTKSYSRCGGRLANCLAQREPGVRGLVVLVGALRERDLLVHDAGVEVRGGKRGVEIEGQLGVYGIWAH